MATSKTPAVKLVVSNGQPIKPITAVASDDSKMEYFCMRVEDERPVETHGPFPSQRAAEDAIGEWYTDGEWYICTKTKVVVKTTANERKH